MNRVSFLTGPLFTGTVFMGARADDTFFILHPDKHGVTLSAYARRAGGMSQMMKRKRNRADQRLQTGGPSAHPHTQG